VAYNLVRLEMQRVADDAGVEPTRISFVAVLRLICECLWGAVATLGAIPSPTEPTCQTEDPDPAAATPRLQLPTPGNGSVHGRILGRGANASDNGSVPGDNRGDRGDKERHVCPDRAYLCRGLRGHVAYPPWCCLRTEPTSPRRSCR